MSEKDRALRDDPVVAWARSSSPTAAASTARTWPASRTTTLGDRALAVTADSPSYPERHRADGAATSPRGSACSTRSSTPRELERPEYRANPDESLLLLQARALHAPDARSPRAARRGRRRRQQRRRSRRLPARAAGGARVRRAQPARRGRPAQGRDPRALARRRACRPGTSRPRPACRRAFRITAK